MHLFPFLAVGMLVAAPVAAAPAAGTVLICRDAQYNDYKSGAASYRWPTFSLSISGERVTVEHSPQLGDLRISSTTHDTLYIRSIAANGSLNRLDGKLFLRVPSLTPNKLSASLTATCSPGKQLF